MLTISFETPEKAILLRDETEIGHSVLQNNIIETFFILPSARRKGYGTWFYKKLLHHYDITLQATLFAYAPTPDSRAFFQKFGFCNHNATHVCRKQTRQVNALSIAHAFIQAHLKNGGFAIDATAGNGHDTAFLCRLVGKTGRVLALDIQPQAVENTNARLKADGLSQGKAICANHNLLCQFSAPETADAIMFNLGYLPGGRHDVFTTSQESLPALRAALSLLRPGGVLSICAYSGGAQGTQERDAVLQFAQNLSSDLYNVHIEQFPLRTGFPPIVICIQKYSFTKFSQHE